MASKHRLSLVFLFCFGLSVKSDPECDLTEGSAERKEFPNIRDLAKLSFQMNVMFTLSSPKKKQTDFFKEYYDVQGKRGRVEGLTKGSAMTYYYYKDTNESFAVMGEICESLNLNAKPSFYNEKVTEWGFDDDIRGPSAMFANALEEWEKNAENMVYMGQLQDDLVNGLKAQYWRRCRGKQTVDYFFTVDEHEDAFGFEDLRQVPLRVSFGKSDDNSEDFPQTYDVVSFQPYVINMEETLKVPSGIGCRRSPNLTEVPQLPDFNDRTIYTYGDASYFYTDPDAHIWNYVSNFELAIDDQIDVAYYSYTPWGGLKGKSQTPGSLMHIVYDMKQKYLYRMDLGNDQCTISRANSFLPKYYLPESGGAITLTDTMILYPNDEFRYITESIDRGYKVHTFEANQTNYDLENRTIPRAVFTHNYVIEDITIDSFQTIKSSPSSYQIKFYAKPTEPATEILTMNLYGFSSKVPMRRRLFNVEKCFKNDDDYLWINIGFPADPITLEVIKTESPNIEANIMDFILLNSELTSLRVPNIFVDISDMLYVSVMILDKPTVMLDFLVGETGKTITKAEAVEGQLGLTECANKCLETETTCWGFSLCGSTCFIGADEQGEVSEKADCQLFQRFSNSSAAPTKETAAKGLKSFVDNDGFKIAIPNLKDSYAQPLFLTASYFVISDVDESSGNFGGRGKTDSRFRVVRAGAKLEKTGESVKNFGRLRYDECQKLCLDYQQCETVSYCGKDSSCVLSKTYAEKIPETDLKEDNYCIVLTRKYGDHFDRSGGDVLADKSDKELKLANAEDCARACMTEKSFTCMSFDLCPAYENACLLHKNHKLTMDTQEPTTKKDTGCGHYSKKFSYTFKRQENKVSMGTGFVASTNASLEQCAMLCAEFSNGFCYGYDFCQGSTLTSSSCTLLTEDPSGFKTGYSPICTHFLQSAAAPVEVVTKSKAAWVGIICFIVAAVFGVLLTYGIAYCRANRAQ